MTFGQKVLSQGSQDGGQGGGAEKHRKELKCKVSMTSTVPATGEAEAGRSLKPSS
jgi:hypothetical protein